MELKIKNIERILLDIPFQEHPGKELRRQLFRWTVSEVCRVEAEGGLLGYGETIVHYTWGQVTDAAVKKVLGRNAFDFLWDDSLGAGLQMALFDLAGKALDVPCHRLLGKQVRDWCPFSWWGIDMAAKEFAIEAQEAVQSGYTSYKIKARPWFDIFEQVEAISKVVPPQFNLDLDFNGFLLNAGRALHILKELEKYPNVSIFESPIPQADVAGNVQLRNQVSRPIAMHHGSPPIMTALREDVCDGFVIHGGANMVMANGAVAAQANKPFWLQLVGTGLTAAFAIQLGAVLTHARWPAVTCQHMYSDDLLATPIELKGGYARVPEAPGLGFQVDEKALARYRATPQLEKPAPEALYAIIWADGRRTYYANAADYNADFMAGNQPIFERGVRLEEIPNDGSKEWKELRGRTKASPVRE